MKDLKKEIREIVLTSFYNVGVVETNVLADQTTNALLALFVKEIATLKNGAQFRRAEQQQKIIQALELQLVKANENSKSACDILDYSVEELKNERVRLAKAKEAISLILPMAKGYAYKNDVGSNIKYVRIAEDTLTEIGG